MVVITKKKHIDPKFCELAIPLQSCVVFSAGIERMFSTYSIMQDKSRNGLGNKHTSKLINCYRMVGWAAG